MPSLTDIPQYQFDQPSKAKLFGWLMPLPIPTETRKAIASQWSKQTGVTFDQQDWNLLNSNREQRRLPNGTPIPAPAKR